MSQNTPPKGIQMKRYALVAAPAASVEPYLPSNYTAIQTPDNRTVIEGRDSAGWTLDGFVIPRLASGLYFAEEIDLSHPVMKTI